MRGPLVIVCSRVEALDPLRVVPASRRGVCSRCHCEVWLAPSSQLALEEYVPRPVLVCTVCLPDDPEECALVLPQVLPGQPVEVEAEVRRRARRWWRGGPSAV